MVRRTIVGLIALLFGLLFLLFVANRMVFGAKPDMVITDDPVRKRVGEVLLAQTRARAARHLCPAEPYDLLVVDADTDRTWRSWVYAFDGQTTIAIEWPFETDVAGRRPPDMLPFEYYLRPESRNHVLPHELGHGIMTQVVLGESIWSRLRQSAFERDSVYGSLAPDWLDEMAAIAFEPETARKGRARTLALHRARGKAASLSSILSHDRSGEMDRVVGARSFADASGLPVGTYETLSELLRYLEERLGQRCVIERLAQAYREGQDPMALLLSWHQDDMAVLETSFDQWLSENEPDISTILNLEAVAAPNEE